MPDRHAVRTRGCKDVPVGGALNIASNPQFPDAKIFKNGWQTAKVIFMGMREDDNVNLLQPARPQVRRNDILAHVDSGAHPARMKISKFAAPIDQHRAPAREGKKKAVALAHVEYRQFQTLGSETRRKWMRGD